MRPRDTRHVHHTPTRLLEIKLKYVFEFRKKKGEKNLTKVARAYNSTWCLNISQNSMCEHFVCTFAQQKSIFERNVYIFGKSSKFSGEMYDFEDLSIWRSVCVGPCVRHLANTVWFLFTLGVFQLPPRVDQRHSQMVAQLIGRPVQSFVHTTSWTRCGVERFGSQVRLLIFIKMAHAWL